MIQGKLAAIKHGISINRPGVASVMAIPLAGLAAPTDMMQIMLNETSGGFTDGAVYQQLATNPGYNWLDLANDFPYPFEFKEDTSPTAQNTFFLYAVTQLVPHDDFLSLGQVLRAMDRNEWVLAVQQNNGQSRLIGYSNGRGAKFKDKYDSGKVGKASSAHAIGYTWESSERAIYLADPSTQPMLILGENPFINVGGHIEYFLSALNLTLPQSIDIKYASLSDSYVYSSSVTVVTSRGLGLDTSTHLRSGKFWMQVSITIGGITYYSNQVLITRP